MVSLVEGQLPRCEACINFKPSEIEDMGTCIINPPVIILVPKHPTLHFGDTQGKWPKVYKDQCCAKGIFLIIYGISYTEHTYRECLALNRVKK